MPEQENVSFHHDSSSPSLSLKDVRANCYCASLLRTNIHATSSMSAKLEPAISPRNTGQRILCFDRCHLIIAWTSNIKEVHGKPRLYVSGDLGLLFGRHVARLRRRRRRAYAPTSNTASHYNHEKFHSWASFSFA